MEADIASQAVGLGTNTDFSLLSLFLRADIVVKSVIIILILCSIYSWAVIIEKFRLFKKINKSSEEFEEKFWNSKSAENFYNSLPIKVEDPMSAVLAPLSALGAIGGVFDFANIPKAGLMGLKRYQAKTMDGGGGGIGGLPQPQQETTKDLAGYKSNTLEEAKSVSGELSPKALLQYVKSGKRTNPSNNKTGTALKQTEIDEIDFEAFEAQYPNKDYTNEDILQYIDDNRIQLYRV